VALTRIGVTHTRRFGGAELPSQPSRRGAITCASAFKKLLTLPGVTVTSVVFAGAGVVVGRRLRAGVPVRVEGPGGL
jgi:hypothetical protein